MSLFDAMDMAMSGMNTGAAMVGNAGISLGNMFLQNLQATRANVLQDSGNANQASVQTGSTNQGTSAGIQGAIGHAMCNDDPASDLVQMMQGKEMYGANAMLVKITDQMVGTLLDTVNDS